MGDNVSRRDFLKTTSISAAGISAMSVKQLSAAFGPAQDKSKVVIATDEDCIQGNQVNEDRVQDMVDYTIMTLTGIADKAAAYESLFPDGVTTSTKILIKYNNSRTQSSLSQTKVINAFINGLTYMVNGSFPSSNVTKMGRQSDSGNSSNETFQCGNNTYSVGQKWIDCDYFINLPSAWNISYTGVTMALKGMMPAVTGSLSGMHNYFTSGTSPALSLVSKQETFKTKQVLVLLDAISICPSSNNVTTGYKIVASKDMVACDYQGMLILKENGLSSSNETTALKVLELAAEHDLGTDDPNEMEVINIGPPWTTEIITNGNGKVNLKDFPVTNQPMGTVFNHPGGPAAVTIYDMQGRRVWAARSSERRIVWNYSNLHGRRVSSGMYLYQMRKGDMRVQGKIAVK